MPRILLLFTLSVVCGAASAAPVVVVSISPIHAIVADVTDGVVEPNLLVDPSQSPHGYTLRPSEAGALAQADVVVWVGAELETFLRGPLSTLAADARVVALLSESAIETLPYRDVLEHDGHHHGDIDPHIWLSFENARRIATTVAEVLAQVDPPNASRYAGNAERAASRYESLEKKIRADFEALTGVPFMVFHDAYQYFEREMGLNNRGAVTLRADLAPGVERMRRLQDTIRREGVRCIFSEPQFPGRLVRAVAEGSDATIAELDPLGLDVSNQPNAYEHLMMAFAASMRECLSRK